MQTNASTAYTAPPAYSRLQIEYLTRRAISQRTAAAAGILPLTQDEAEASAEKYGLPKAPPCGGLLIPYRPTKEGLRVFRFRLDQTENTKPGPCEGSHHGETTVTYPKFFATKNTEVIPYIAPKTLLSQEIRDDSKIPLCFVEGPFKALAMIQAGFPAIGAGGVMAGFHDVEARRAGHLTLHKELAARLVLQERDVIVVFDAGRSTNPLVALGEAWAALVFEEAGARVRVAALPFFENRKDEFWTRNDQGPDDFLFHEGPKAMRAVLDAALPANPIARAQTAVVGKTEEKIAAVSALLKDLPFVASLYLRGELAIESLASFLKPTLWCHGLAYVTALHGLDGPTVDLVAAISKHKPKRIVLVFRRSKEGDAAVERLAPVIAGMDVEVRKGVLPRNMDVSDLAMSSPNPAEVLAQVIRSAEWVAGKAPAGDAVAGRAGVLVESRSSSEAANPAVERKAISGSQPASANMTGDEVVFEFEERRWRVRGLASNTAPGSMKVNVFVAHEAVGFHVDVFDLYSARHRTAFVRQAGQELGLDEQVVKKDLGRVLLALERAQDELPRGLHQPEPKPAEMTPDERTAALELLHDPKLLDHVLDDFEAVGVVGERTNLAIGFLVAISRKLPRPLALVIQSSSAAGKSSLMEAILSFVPEEDRVSFTAMTGQSLYYMGASALKHKVLSIAEEEGAKKASYSLKLLQSEGTLTIASTGKDTTGRLVAQEYKVEGPVALVTTTTALDVDEELLNRCIVVSVDESAEQTKRIHERQRRAQTLEGLLGGDERDGVVRRQQNAQRLLLPVKVVNPHAITMTYPDLRVRARRDHRKLLTTIDAIALVHQHQRKARQVERDGHAVEYVEADAMDVHRAEKLLREVGALGGDDLPPQTRRLLERLDAYAHEQVKTNGKGEVRFSRRQVREALRLGDATLKVHLRRLVEAEFVVAHREPGGIGVTYSLAVNGYATDLGRGSDGGWMGGGLGSDGPHVSPESPTASVASAPKGTSKAKKRTPGHEPNGVVRVPRS